VLNISETDEVDLTHVDTSCLLLHRSAFGLNSVWSQMPIQISSICDRIFYRAVINKGCRVAHSKLRTVAFRTTYPGHYVAAGIKPPENNKIETIKQANAYLTTMAGVKETVSRLGFWPYS
jgi:hypothetical protein